MLGAAFQGIYGNSHIPQYMVVGGAGPKTNVSLDGITWNQ